MDALSRERDFFISYRSADQPYAEWIAHVLEDAGYTTFVQAWDFRPGQNFVHQMQQGVSSCRQTIAVLTPAYFESGFTGAEWYSAFAKDPTGKECRLIPVRVQECDIGGLLGQIIYIDLVGLDKTQASERLLAGIEGRRAKPSQPSDIFPDTPDNRKKRVVPRLPPPSPEDRRGLLILLDRVKQDWVEGVLEQSVQHEALINLGKETKTDAVERPWEQVLELPDAAGRSLPADARMIDVFEDVGRLLLILGEPGSGKTMTLLELARELADRARSDGGQPVPVVFNLSSWKEEFRALSDWLTEELKTKYLIPKRIGRSWLNGNQLVPLLDGLDEVQPDRRTACIRAINTFLEEHGMQGVVVCSRLQEYTAAPLRLKMRGAICLQALTATQVESYLSRLGPQLDALRTALNKDDMLRDLAKSPLMLSVMTLAYQGASINALAREAVETHEARRKQIFDTYVARMFARKGKAAGSAHATEQTTIWLSWLAHNMQRHGLSIFLIAQMQPSWLANLRQIFIYLLSSRLATVAAIWVALCLWGIGLRVGVREYDSMLDTAIGSSSNFYWMLGAQILILLLGTFSACSIDLSRYYVVERWLSESRIFQNVINNQFLVLFAHMSAWAVVATAIHILLFFRLEESITVITSIVIQWGLVLGFLSCRRSMSQDIRLHDRLTWSWTGSMIFSIPTVIGAIFYITIFLLAKLDFKIAKETVLPVMAFLGDSFGPLSVLLLIVGPPLSLLVGLRSSVREMEERGNYGIRSALVNACRAGLCLLACGMFGIGFLYFFFLSLGGYAVASSMLATTHFFTATIVTVAVIVALIFGGVDVINHYALRLVVYRNGYAPKKLHRFLDECTKLVFLRRVGGGYVFIHRLLLEHFATMWETEHMQKGARAAVMPGSAVAAPT